MGTTHTADWREVCGLHWTGSASLSGDATSRVMFVEVLLLPGLPPSVSRHVCIINQLEASSGRGGCVGFSVCQLIIHDVSVEVTSSGILDNEL